MEKLYQQFKNEHPETVGEKDKHFDLSNYKDWLERNHIELLAEKKELIECLIDVIGAVNSVYIGYKFPNTLDKAQQLINKLTK